MLLLKTSSSCQVFRISTSTVLVLETCLLLARYPDHQSRNLLVAFYFCGPLSLWNGFDYNPNISPLEVVRCLRPVSLMSIGCISCVSQGEKIAPLSYGSKAYQGMADFKSQINQLADDRTQRISRTFVHSQEKDGFLPLRVFRIQRKTGTTVMQFT